MPPFKAAWGLGAGAKKPVRNVREMCTHEHPQRNMLMWHEAFSLRRDAERRVVLSWLPNSGREARPAF